MKLQLLGLAAGAGLAIGALTGYAVSARAPAPVAVVEPPSCVEAVARVRGLEERVAALAARAGEPLAAVAVHSPAPGHTDPGLQAELEALRARVEELLAQPACAATPEALRAADDAKRDDPRNADALREARDVVAYAIEDGRWTREDAASLQELLPLLTAKQQDEVLGQLIPALNDGLEVEFFPPL